ncbi:MAG: hypothetical protein K2P22_08780 [Lachnospiraceae bacterium]|nr:hypothetical protein [Lachnospiraceae bacterium]
MNRTSKYTLLSLLFAAVFVFGSMAGTDLILQMWEKRRLQESGTVTMESPVLAWQSAETEEEYVKQDGGPFDRDIEEDLTLTEKEIEQVIRYRKNCEGELLHDPVKGQITMEQAFASGENWLIEMGVWDHSRTHSEPLLHRASLGTKTAKEGLHMPIEPYYSFWTVRFSSTDMYVSLSVNAMTGRVWDAKITLYDIENVNNDKSLDKLERFIRLAGIEAPVEQYVEISDSGSWISMAVKESPLYAQMRGYDVVVSVMDEIMESDGSKDVSSQTVIEYRLMVYEDSSMNAD